MEQRGRIRKARDSLNMTQDRLAAAAGLSKRTVIRAEKGGTVSKETASALSSVLGIEVLAVSAEAEASPSVPAAPTDPLMAEIAARGEAVRWEGVPDRAGWEKVNHPEAWYALHHLMSAAGAAMVPVYAVCLMDSWDAGNMPGVGLGGLCMGLCAWLSVRTARSVSRHRAKLEEMERTRLVATDRAFYREVSGGHGQSGTVRRVALNRWTTVRDRAAYLLWPMARVTEIGDGEGREFVVAVPGLDQTIRAITAELRRAS